MGGGRALQQSRHGNTCMRTIVIASCAADNRDHNAGKFDKREDLMGAFIMACVAFVVLGAGGFFALNEAQKPAGAAYSTQSTRIDPTWSWRVPTGAGNEFCEPRRSWQWLFVDFRSPRGESPLCSDSQ
jgi:hypothetical protein